MKKITLVLTLVVAAQFFSSDVVFAYRIFSSTDDSTQFTSSNSNFLHWEAQYLGVAPVTTTIHSITVKITNPQILDDCALMLTETNSFGLSTTTASFDVSNSIGGESDIRFVNDWDLANYDGFPTTTPAVNGACTFYSSRGYQVASGTAYTLWLSSRWGNPRIYSYLGSSNSTPTNFGTVNGSAILQSLHSMTNLFYILDSELKPTPPPYYGQIKNTVGGSMNLRSGSSTSASIIKTLPEDWIVYVDNTIDSNGNLITSNGYNWYQVTDPTDGVSGWIIGENSARTIEYLPYNISKQAAFTATSTSYVATSSRPALIQTAVNHYYNNTSTSSSLYSSDNDAGNKISQLKNGGYPEEVIWGIAAQEDGGAILGFNNENVSSDYGHGIMQITFSPSYPFDNRGISSNITIAPCSLGSSLYTNCYTSADGTSPFLRHYQAYSNDPANPTYKQYTNTEQSIFANIKDGLYILAQKYDVFDSINTSATVNGVTYSADERKNILTTQYYNGGNDDACRYVDSVADKLDSIATYFPNATTSAISGLVQKMHSAGTDVICVDLHSPGDLSVEDSNGRVVGSVNGKEENDFPLAVYDKEGKFLQILAAEDDNYTYKIVGTDKGTYGLDVSIKKGEDILSFKAKDIPMLPGQIHSYSIDEKALKEGVGGVTLYVDRKGNGGNRIIESGSLLTGEAYNVGATVEELEAFEIGDKHPEYKAPNRSKIYEGLPSSVKPYKKDERKSEGYQPLLKGNLFIGSDN